VGLVRVARAAKAGRQRAAAVTVTVMVALLAAACTSSTHELGGTASGGTGGAAGAVASTGTAASTGAAGSASASPTPAGPTVAISPANGAKAADPSAGVTVTAARGTLTSVTVTPTGAPAADSGNPSGPVPGALSPNGTSWHTTWALGVSQQYTVTAVATDDGGAKTITSTFTTLTPAATFSTNIFEGYGQTYGVGMPLILTFSQPITDKAAVERSLQIKASKPVVGAWYWDTDESLAFRPRSYWPPNTTVSFTGHLDGVKAGAGLYGFHTLTQTFTIGQSVIAVASTTSHHTQVYVGGKLAYTWPVSTGRPGDATPNGTYLTIEKANPVLMKGPGYSLEVPWSVRFTWSGDYYHDAYWSVGEQGFENVSHGCVNLPPAAAETYYKLAVPGDPITITSSPKAGTWDNGWTDWFLTWRQLLAGSATHEAVEAGPTGSTFVAAATLSAIHVTAPLESAATGIWGNGPA
jgi:lipoprotein-anchoring transpeptidase ErfK/SrfK